MKNNHNNNNNNGNKMCQVRSKAQKNNHNKNRCRPNKMATAWLTIRSEPIIQDPREMETILGTSLRTLFGDFECYSSAMKVIQVQRKQEPTTTTPAGLELLNVRNQIQQQEEAKDEEQVLQVTCPFHHIGAIRAAMTWLTVPPYMEEEQSKIGLHRMEIINIVTKKTSIHG